MRWLAARERNGDLKPIEKEPLRVMDGCLEMAAPPKGPGREPGNTAPGGSHAEVVVVVTPLGRSAGDGTTLCLRVACHVDRFSANHRASARALIGFAGLQLALQHGVATRRL